MNAINKFVINYLKWASPIAIIAAVLSALGKADGTILYDAIGIVTIIWLVLLAYLVFALAFQDQLRNRFVRWVAGIKENDEREFFIAGQASKKTFIFMTGFIILLIFLSVIRIDIYQNKALGPEGKKIGEIRLGLGASIIQDFNHEATQSENDRTYFIHYKGFPLSVDGTLIFVGLIQIGAFYYFSRKEENS
jgi:hypothetical protein